MSPAFTAIAVTLVVLALGGGIFALTKGSPLRVAGRRSLPVPTSWIVLGAMLLVLGIVIMPKILGFTFLFLPMIWSRRARGPRRPGGSGPGGSRRQTDRDPHDEDR